MKCICGEPLKKQKKDYHYTESGLDNVILSGINVFECSECGEIFPEIIGINELHKQIGLALVKKRSQLKGKEIRFIRKLLGFNEKKFASIMGVDPVSVSRWENSKADVGMTSDKLIRMLFIQSLEEECNKVARDAVGLISSLRKKVELEKPIKIPLLKGSFCLSLSK